MIRACDIFWIPSFKFCTNILCIFYKMYVFLFIVLLSTEIQEIQRKYKVLRGLNTLSRFFTICNKGLPVCFLAPSKRGYTLKGKKYAPK